MWVHFEKTPGGVIPPRRRTPAVGDTGLTGEKSRDPPSTLSPYVELFSINASKRPPA